MPSPPVGEGSSYEVSCNDLRPTLEWSPDGGWIVPIYEVALFPYIYIFMAICIVFSFYSMLKFCYVDPIEVALKAF